MATLTPLFNWFILRPLRREALRTAMTVAGLALGIAVIVAIQLANASSLAGFETALNIVSGRTALELVGPGVGIDETALPSLTWLREYGELSPVIEGDLVARPTDGQPSVLRVLGVDVLRDQPLRDYRLLEWTRGGEPTPQEFLALLLDEKSAIFTARFAAARGLRVGDAVPVEAGDRKASLVVRALLKDEGPARVLDGNFVLMDIAAAQRLFDRFGRVDRVDVRLRDPSAIDRTEPAIRDRLPPGITVQRPAQRGRQVENMLAAFHLNLTALSYIALLVGLFLVYNTASVAVIARRREIGMLRALGVTRTRIRLLFLGESAVLAAVGSAVGLLLARLLADAAVGLTSRTVSTLYIADASSPPQLTWHEVVLAFGIGVPLSMLAAVLPAAEAARVSPIEAIRGADRCLEGSERTANMIWPACMLLGLGAWLATRGPVGGRPVFGYLAALAIAFGASLLVPSVLTAVVRYTTKPIRELFGVAPWLAMANLSGAIRRISISIAALMISVSMMVALAVMIGSFRETVIYWVAQTLQADLFVAPAAGQGPGRTQTLSADVVEAVARDPEVEAVDRFRNIEMPFRDSLVRVGSGEYQVLLAHGTLLFKTPSDQPRAREAMVAAVGQDALIASESFSLKYGVSAGDIVLLPTPHGPVRFSVAAVYYDYSSDRGVVVMDRGTFARHFGEHSPTTMSVYLRPGADVDRARDRLLARFGAERHVAINTNASLRREVLRIFDSTFAITYALELIAVVVAILGITGTLVTLALEREAELTMLRLIGASRRQIRRMILAEAALIGAVSQAIGLIVGLALSMILIYVVNVQSFGWTIQFHLPWPFFVQSTVLLIAAACLAGLYPARRAGKLVVLHEE